jgi:hypothetical protein
LQAKNGRQDNEYLLDDDKAAAGIIYYRLRIIEKDGKISYSHVITINRNKLSSMVLFPNPAKDRLNISYAKAESGARLTVYGMNGQKILEPAIQSGSLMVSLNVSALPKGLYMIRFENNGQVQTERFIKE